MRRAGLGSDTAAGVALSPSGTSATTTSAPANVQATSTSTAPGAQPPSTSRGPQRVAQRPGRQPAEPPARARRAAPAGATTPPPASSSTQTRLAAASTPSARIVPASSSPRLTKAAVPEQHRDSGGRQPAGGRPPAERQRDRGRAPPAAPPPRRAPPAPGRRAARRRPSGVVPSSRSTPYRRSKPVAIACPVNAVDISASASTPGATRSIRRPGAEVGRSLQGAEPDQDQQRQHQGEQQLLAVAQHRPGVEPGLGEHPRAGRGAGRGRRPERAGTARRREQRCPALTPRDPPVSSRNTSSRLRRPSARSCGIRPPGRAPGGHRGDHLRIQPVRPAPPCAT